MKSEMNSLNKVALLMLVALLAFVGCTTVAPRTVQSNSASWDGTNQNSGFIGWNGRSGIITPHARDRYNALIEIYGKRFTPPITADYGITFVPEIDTDYGFTGTYSNVFLITPEALADFSRMNRWRKLDAP